MGSIEAMSGGTEDIVDIYTDGSCSGNPGPGAFGVCLPPLRNCHSGDEQ